MGEDQIDGVELRSIHRVGHYVLAHRAIAGGTWQATWFDEHGPGGDLRRMTLEQALNEQAPAAEYTITAIHLMGERVRTNPAPFEELETERWDDGTVVTFLQSPFPYARKPVVPSSLHRTAKRERILLDKLIGSQARVTDIGLQKHARGGGEPPLIYRTSDGALHIADGHHRLAAAVRRGERHATVRVVDVPKENPAMAEPTKAIRMFRKFHTRDWRGEGDFHPDLAIPDDVVMLGPAVNTDYESDKLNPETGHDEGWIQYTHEHDAGVHIYIPGSPSAIHRKVCRVPAWIGNVDQLTWLGRCLGFSYKNEQGKVCKMEGTKPLPELYAIPSGKALLVIQSKRKLLAIIWGGRLKVERRGIVH